MLHITQLPWFVVCTKDLFYPVAFLFLCTFENIFTVLKISQKRKMLWPCRSFIFELNPWHQKLGPNCVFPASCIFQPARSLDVKRLMLKIRQADFLKGKIYLFRTNIAANCFVVQQAVLGRKCVHCRRSFVYCFSFIQGDAHEVMVSARGTTVRSNTKGQNTDDWFRGPTATQ